MTVKSADNKTLLNDKAGTVKLGSVVSMYMLWFAAHA